MRELLAEYRIPFTLLGVGAVVALLTADALLVLLAQAVVLFSFHVLWPPKRPEPPIWEDRR